MGTGAAPLFGAGRTTAVPAVSACFEKRTKTLGCIVDLKKKKRLLCRLRGGRFTVSRGNLSGGKGKNAGGTQSSDGGKREKAGAGKFQTQSGSSVYGGLFRLFSNAASGSACGRCCCAFFKERLSKTKPKRAVPGSAGFRRKSRRGAGFRR